MTTREDHDKESARSKSEREKTQREDANILAKIHRQHSKTKERATNLKEVENRLVKMSYRLTGLDVLTGVW